MILVHLYIPFAKVKVPFPTLQKVLIGLSQRLDYNGALVKRSKIDQNDTFNNRVIYVSVQNRRKHLENRKNEPVGCPFLFLRFLLRKVFHSEAQCDKESQVCKKEFAHQQINKSDQKHTNHHHYVVKGNLNFILDLRQLF